MMGCRRINWVFAIATMLAVGSVDAKDAMTSTGDPETIFQLLDQLSSNDYQEREAAHATLRDLGMPILPYLTDRFEASEDLETQLRVQRVIEHVYFWDHVFSRNAFLGIQHVEYRNPADGRLGEGEAGIEIRNIIEGTSAERAGLKRGDLIIGVDGQRLGSDINRGTFADMIRSKVPGDAMEFLVYRGSELQTHRIELGYRPTKLYSGRALPRDIKTQYDEAVTEFHDWWRGELGHLDDQPHDITEQMLRVGPEAQPLSDYSDLPPDP